MSRFPILFQTIYQPVLTRTFQVAPDILIMLTRTATALHYTALTPPIMVVCQALAALIVISIPHIVMVILTDTTVSMDLVWALAFRWHGGLELIIRGEALIMEWIPGVWVWTMGMADSMVITQVGIGLRLSLLVGVTPMDPELFMESALHAATIWIIM